MWLVTNKGFMSVVAKDRNGKPSGTAPDAEVSVRFRRPQDAKALFPDLPFVATPKGDYAGRVFATRQHVAWVIASCVLADAKSPSPVTYTNFKDSIGKDDNQLHDVCMSAWHVFGRLQKGGPYGRGNWGNAYEEAQRENARRNARQPYQGSLLDGIPVVPGIPRNRRQDDLFPSANSLRDAPFDPLDDGSLWDDLNDPSLADEAGQQGFCLNCEGFHVLDEAELCEECAAHFAATGEAR